MEHKSSGLLIVGIVVAVLVIGFGAYWFYGRPPSGPGPEEVACTMEALLCPDGSYVGRSGPTCAFSPCPNQEAFTGELRRNAYGFSLIIPTPEGGTGASYALPLDPGELGIPAEAVGRVVRVTGTFTEGIRLLVGGVDLLTGDAGNRTLGGAGVGESVFVNGVNITVNAITEDSRCPIDVVCIQAGRVTANVSLRSDTDSETRDISSDDQPVGFDSYRVSIESVEPSPRAGAVPASGEYRIVFRVLSN